MTSPRSLKYIVPQLEDLYNRYNRREYVSPDPLQFLYDYPDIKDREIVGMLASALAYGKVKQILKSVARVLETLGTSPYKTLMSMTFLNLRQTMQGIKHRFATSEDIAMMLWGIKRMIGEYGSLEAGFMAGFEGNTDTIIPSLINFVSKIRQLIEDDTKALNLTTNQNYVGYIGGFNHLLPKPERGGASKRLNLFLRWMVRKDAVDPGGWKILPKSKLVVPIDVHMHRIGLALGLTTRKQANLKTALDITAAFREISPDDPVKYDFSLTRFGIRDDINFDGFFSVYGIGKF